MFDIIALVCALGQVPQDCIPQTARSVYELGQSDSELACMRQAQMSDGKVSLTSNPDEYKKFMCVRRKL